MPISLPRPTCRVHPLIRFRSCRSVTVLGIVCIASVLSGCIGARHSPSAGLDPKSSALHHSLSIAASALAAGQPHVALRLYRSLFQAFPDHPLVLLGIGESAFSLGDFPLSSKTYRSVLALKPSNPALRDTALVGVARSLLALDRPSEVLSLSPVHHLPSDALARASFVNALGVAHGLSGAPDQSLDHLRKAASFDPANPRIAANLVRRLASLNRHDSAQALVSSHPPDFWHPFDLPWITSLPLSASLSSPSHTSMRLSNFSPSYSPPGLHSLSSGLVLSLPPASPSPRAQPLPRLVTLTRGAAHPLPVDTTVNAVSVADPLIVEVQLLSPNLVYAIGKSYGLSTVSLLLDDGSVEQWSVQVGPDRARLQHLLDSDDTFSKVSLDSSPNQIIVSGSVASSQDVARLLNRIRSLVPADFPVRSDLLVATPHQVNLEVKIAEVSRSVTDHLGVSWENFHTSGGGSSGFRIGRLLSVPPSVLPVDGRPSSSFFFSRGSASSRFGVLLDALSSAGLANVLATPNITAVSGEPASFFSGGEFPLPTGLKDGAVVFDYRRYGVLLDFVPTVVGPDRIVLLVRPEVSEPSLTQSLSVAAGVDVPVINVRRAETTVEVADSQSILIAGLFRQRADTFESGLPVLKDIPALGLLFGQTLNRSDELELIVIVTATLVTASSDPPSSDPPRSPRPLVRRIPLLMNILLGCTALILVLASLAGCVPRLAERDPFFHPGNRPHALLQAKVDSTLAEHRQDAPDGLSCASHPSSVGCPPVRAAGSVLSAYERWYQGNAASLPSSSQTGSGPSGS